MVMSWDKLLDDWRYRWVVKGQRPNPTPGELRTEFEKDYDRAVFSTPVRRLQDKAQVFPLEPSDAVRTRLTHSLEVSTVARDMARAVGRWIVDEKKPEIAGEELVRAMETIAATCGLLHDLGNPPFGHFGERAIQDWFKAEERADTIFEGLDGGKDGALAKDFLMFEGNAQTLRLVARLQVLVDEFGLNLTCATLSALCKYTASAEQAGTPNRHDWSKPGYFASEKALIETVRERTGTGDARHPLTFLVEACDDLVYRVVDLEDGVKKGAVDWETAKKALLAKGQEKAQVIIEKAVEQVGAPGKELKGPPYDEAIVQAFRIHAIAAVVPSVIATFKGHYDEIMRGEFYQDLTEVCDHKDVLEALGGVVREHVHPSQDILRLELMGHRVIGDLMTVFWKGAETGTPGTKTYSQKSYSLISNNYRRMCEDAVKTSGLPVRYCRLQLVTDYICGMTDTFACSLHRRLMNV
jgi:dGTPase